MNALEEISGMVKKAGGFNLGSIFRNMPITNPTLKRMAASPIDYSKPRWSNKIKSWKADESKNRQQYAKQEADWEKKVVSDYARQTGNTLASAKAVFDGYRGKMSPGQVAQLPSMKMQGQMGAEGAAYQEILKRLNANGGDPSINMQNARRLAPMVAKNYRRQADGSWKAVSQSGAAQAKQMARKMPSGMYPKA